MVVARATSAVFSFANIAIGAECFSESHADIHHYEETTRIIDSERPSFPSCFPFSTMAAIILMLQSSTMFLLLSFSIIALRNCTVMYCMASLWRVGEVGASYTPMSYLRHCRSLSLFGNRAHLLYNIGWYLHTSCSHESSFVPKREIL